jgi:hypothetical protein
MAITSYLDDFDVDPETKQVLDLALEMTRTALGLADDLANGIIAKAHHRTCPGRRAASRSVVRRRIEDFTRAFVRRLNQRVIKRPGFAALQNGPAGSVWGYIRPSFARPKGAPSDCGSGLARGQKQSQAVIVGRVSLEAAPPSACHDHAETVSILVNSRKAF